MTPPTTPSRPAFTLLEATLSIVLMSILAIAVLPAISMIDCANQGSARNEALRILTRAQSNAMTTGQPTAVAIDVPTSTLTLLWIPAESAPIAPLPDPMGQPTPATHITDTFKGASILDFIDAQGVPGSATVWFAFDAVPELRDPAGVLIGPAPQDALLTLSTQQPITISAASGLIE